MQYIAFIHKNADSLPIADEWEEFFSLSEEAGMFKGGSMIGERWLLGEKEVADTSESVGGYMRFDSDDLDRLRRLLESHPVVVRGGAIELFEMPES